MENIVILGGSYAGISTAHRILKQASKTGHFKITLVSPNTDLYWNMASPRGILPDQIPDEKLFQPIAAGFSKYPGHQFEFILATAESLDVDAKNVEISSLEGNQVLSYDFLILATGSRTIGGAPFKGLGTTEETKDQLHGFQGRVKKAKTIVVAGGGVTSVEVAGELGFEYGRGKNIILIASGPSLLEGTPSSISKYATKELQNLKIDIRLSTRVVSSTYLSSSQQELTLATGETLTTDLYIPTFGLTPNSSYIPAKFLNAQKYAIVNTYLQLKETKDIWAIGDVSNVENSQFISCDRQSAYLAKNIVALLRDGLVAPYKENTVPFMGLQIGKKAGTGHRGNIKLPTFVIVWARKNLFTDRMKSTVDGSGF
ncbi:hypothetical protein BJ875DRAFT_414260 [Amylocarpus encephaloides]|uniref:FAD/NAD(P)-binding domain-containing protein n=1 Tax=Amylocarpus encephaloides TaxID=45428 RepID=A0A9P7YUA8_9HELO|nr:hypothetical protein BJ875DRAFT_414260 [Amylocarpus encephaloides]